MSEIYERGEYVMKVNKGTRRFTTNPQNIPRKYTIEVRECRIETEVLQVFTWEKGKKMKEKKHEQIS